MPSIVEQVIADEIGRGEGANFVIRRDFTAGVDADPATAALTWFRALLEHERGAYWTFAIVTPGHVAVGASPEAHVSARDGLVTMNPISGTFRHPAGGATAETLTEFLESTKETEELFMVVDEELKMMSAVCSDGGRITGPHLKEMSRLTHTEYVLRGRSRLDPRDILRETMFAPTVTGSPMQNACTVITRHERTPRGYYSGVAALFTPRLPAAIVPGEPSHDLDAPILIRTAYLEDGRLRVPVGATLVRHSDPYGEVSETHGKAAGVLGAIGAVPRDRIAEARSTTRRSTRTPPPRGPRLLADDPAIASLLASRNARLAAFWLNPQDAAGDRSARRPDRGRGRRRGPVHHDARASASPSRARGRDRAVERRHRRAARRRGPRRVRTRPRRPARTRQRSACGACARSSRIAGPPGRPLLAVCLSHQILADSLGIELAPLAAPHQGLQKTVDVFGMPASIGFYNTFTARVAPGTTRVGETEVAADAGPATCTRSADRGTRRCRATSSRSSRATA